MSPQRRKPDRRPRKRPTERDRSLPPLTTEPGKASHEHAIEPGVQSMGGKEERVSDVGRARAEVERREREGEERFDIVPGPSSQEILNTDRGPELPLGRTGQDARNAGRIERGGPSGLEPEDKGKPRRR